MPIHSEPAAGTTRSAVASPDSQTDTTSPSYSWEVAGMSHQGMVRSKNEDHFIVARFGRSLETLQTNLPAGDVPARAQEWGYGLVVADGLGGHAGGEVASRSAINLLWDLILKTPDWIFRAEDKEFSQEVMRRAKERYTEIDAALAEQSEHDAALEGMATTLTVAATVGNTVIISHVGDSRAYLLRQGQLYQLTRDHTVIQKLIDQNVISPDNAATHKMRHMLTHALGVHLSKKGPDVHRLVLCDGDCLLLCTDGLSSYVDREIILGIVNSGDKVERICLRLVDAALQAGGRDNVTVAVGRSRRC